MSTPPEILSVRGLRKTYLQAATPVEVLRGAQLSLSAGETVSIVGQSGSGKSTLLSLLAGLDSPTSGSVTIDGQDLAALDEEARASFRARRLSIVFQQFHLMSHLTALENVSLPLEIAGELTAAEATARAALELERVGLAARHAHFPRQLSGGERQRVAIARALVGAPALLLADEPSGNLDARTGATVTDLLFELVRDRGTTLILVTHNADLAARCGRRLKLEDGLLKEYAPT